MKRPELIARSLTELVELQAKISPNVPFVHTGVAELDGLHTITYADFNHAVDRLAHYYSAKGLEAHRMNGVAQERVIGVLINSSIETLITEFALAKMGCTTLHLSVNNSPEAVAQLLKVTNATDLIYGSKFEVTAVAVASEIGPSLTVLAEKRYPLWGPHGAANSSVPPFPRVLPPEKEFNRPCMILHSSGSTGFPTPVPISNSAVMANSSLQNLTPTFLAIPLFHALGNFVMTGIMYHGQTVTLLPPHLPLTLKNMVDTLRETPTPPRCTFAVPFTLQMFSEEPWGVEALLKFDEVYFGGSALANDVGDRLAAAGVNLISIYGATETGYIMNSLRDFKTDKGWNWLRLTDPIRPYIELAPRGEGTFELILKKGWPALVKSNLDNGGYATKDLFRQHPQDPGAFKYFGRLDDTIVHSLGEKTNPLPIENYIIGKTNLISDAIVFGSGRTQCGLLVVLSARGADLASNTKEFVRQIWPIIADANAIAPTHSRITPEMVIVFPFGTQVPKTPKYSLLRPAAYKKFADQIDRAYASLEEGNGIKRKVANQEDMELLLFQYIKEALKGKTASTDDLTNRTDLFSYGVDSIAATRVRNDVAKNVDLGSAKLGQNVIYEHPTIRELAQFLIALGQGTEDEQQNIEASHQLQWELVSKWSDAVIQPSPHRPGEVHETGGEVVLLTGATGTLGAHILDQLAQNPRVSKVICLSRASSHAESRRRVEQSLRTRRRVVSGDRFESLAADVNKPDLGLSKAEYTAICSAITAVVHNAWPVNFNMALSSFEVHIAGAVNLLNLALSSPRLIKPSYFFSSSISTMFAKPVDTIQEVFPESATTAQPIGYAQSKWVVEKIMERVSDRARCVVARIGQMTGDTVNGVWNETESWPLMFHSANEIGELPSLEYHPAWIPLEVAGRSIMELIFATNTTSVLQKPHANVFHIINSHPTEWSTILEGLHRGGLRFEVADRFKWLSSLEHSNPDPTTNSTYKLLWFYKARFGGPQVKDDPEFAVQRTSAVSPAIANCRAIDAELASKWVRNWMQNGFLH